MLKALGKDIIVYGISDFIFRFAAFAVFPIYAQVLSVSEFGIYALVTVSVGLVALLANLGMNNAVQRYYWDESTIPTDRPRLVTTGLVVLLVFSSAVVLTILIIGYVIGVELEHRYSIGWGIISIAILAVIPEQLMQYCLDTVRLQRAPIKYAYISLLKNILGVLLGLVFVLYFNLGLIGLFLGGLLGAVFATPIALFSVRKDIVLAFDSQFSMQLIKYGYPFIFAGFAYWVFGSTDRWMLAILTNNHEVGLYSIAFKFASVIIFFNTAFGLAWSPLAIKIKAENSNYREWYARILSVWLFFLVLVASIFAIASKDILTMLTPSDYWEATSTMVILIVAIVFSGTTQVTAIGISIEKKTGLFVVAAWTTATVNVLLNYFLIPSYGSMGAAYATLISYVVLAFLYFYWSQRLHPIPVEKVKMIYSILILLIVLFICIENRFTESISSNIGMRVGLFLCLLVWAIPLRVIDFSDRFGNNKKSEENFS